MEKAPGEVDPEDWELVYVEFGQTYNAHYDLAGMITGNGYPYQDSGRGSVAFRMGGVPVNTNLFGRIKHKG